MKVGKALLFLVSAFAPGDLLLAQFVPDSGAVLTLVEARSLKCTFPWHASVDWDGDQPQVHSARLQEFGFHIDGIDYREASARIIGNGGAGDLNAIRGMYSVSFVERVPVGSLNLTTVYAWRDKDGHFKAVHSRHTDIGGPIPSQNYGSCQVW